MVRAVEVEGLLIGEEPLVQVKIARSGRQKRGGEHLEADDGLQPIGPAVDR